MRRVATTPARLALVAGLLSCRHTQAPRVTALGPPPGEVWLTDAQLAQMHVAVAPASLEPVDDAILASGRIAFDESRVTHVFSPVPGRVSEIQGALGARVRRGDPLATIESPDVGAASSDVRKAEADLYAAERDLERNRLLVSEGAASRHDLETAEANERRDRAELERARERARLFHVGSYDAITQRFTMRAPIGGEIVARNLAPGAQLQGQYASGTTTELFTIGDIDRVWILADVFEMDLARVRVGQPIRARTVAYPGRVFEGRVDWVSGAFDPATRTARVRCSIDNLGHALRPEMFATVDVQVEARRALAVPAGAVVRLANQTFVFVQDQRVPDGRLRFVRWPVGVDEVHAGPYVPVEHGLAPGTLIATENVILLAGML
jgi:cobalt-zinc-cadmium efflux system membrane fusion protein